MGRTHFELKVSPKEYIAIEKGEKKHYLYEMYEVDDSMIMINKYDILHFHEWTESDGYSGRELIAEVTYTEESRNPYLGFECDCVSFKLL
jgi:hypothetical protein